MKFINTLPNAPKLKSLIASRYIDLLESHASAAFYFPQTIRTFRAGSTNFRIYFPNHVIRVDIRKLRGLTKNTCIARGLYVFNPDLWIPTLHFGDHPALVSVVSLDPLETAKLWTPWFGCIHSGGISCIAQSMEGFTHLDPWELILHMVESFFSVNNMHHSVGQVWKGNQHLNWLDITALLSTVKEEDLKDPDHFLWTNMKNDIKIPLTTQQLFANLEG